MTMRPLIIGSFAAGGWLRRGSRWRPGSALQDAACDTKHSGSAIHRFYREHVRLQPFIVGFAIGSKVNASVTVGAESDDVVRGVGPCVAPAHCVMSFKIQAAVVASEWAGLMAVGRLATAIGTSKDVSVDVARAIIICARSALYALSHIGSRVSSTPQCFPIDFAVGGVIASFYQFLFERFDWPETENDRVSHSPVLVTRSSVFDANKSELSFEALPVPIGFEKEKRSPVLEMVTYRTVVCVPLHVASSTLAEKFKYSVISPTIWVNSPLFWIGCQNYNVFSWRGDDPANLIASKAVDHILQYVRPSDGKAPSHKILLPRHPCVTEAHKIAILSCLPLKVLIFGDETKLLVCVALTFRAFNWTVDRERPLEPAE